MAVNYQNKIVKGGLVLCLDAADRKSYPGSGTTWFDRSGNGNHAALINGPTYNTANGGSIVFNGSNHARIVLPSSINYTTFTHSSWIYATNTTGYRTIIDADNDEWSLFVNDGILISWSPTYSTGYTINMNRWYHVTMAHTFGGPILFYVNGVLVYSTPNDVSQRTISYFGIGAGITSLSTADEFWIGRIAQATIYNKELTAQEIKQNFNATRGRYGI